MDIKDYFEQSWQVFTEFLAPILINTLIVAGVSIITLGIMAPVVLAGYMQSLLLALRDDRKPEIRDLFAHMNLFFPLLGFGILLSLATVIAFAFMTLPSIVLVIAAAFFLLYMLPLMTDQQLGLLEAIKESVSMAMVDPVEHLPVVATYLVLSFIGSLTLIGSLFTLPYSCLIVLFAYERYEKK